MTHAMRPSTLQTLGLGSVFEIFQRGGLPVRTEELVDRVLVRFEAVAESGGVGQQLANRDIGFDLALLVNLELCQRWYPAFGGIVQLKMSPFHQGHQRHAGNRLGHRVNAKIRSSAFTSFPRQILDFQKSRKIPLNPDVR